MRKPSLTEILILFHLVFAFWATTFGGLSTIFYCLVRLAFCAATFAIPVLKPSRIPTLCLVVAGFSTLFVHHVPYLWDWPLDLLFIAAACWLSLRKWSGVDFYLRWSWRFSRQEWLSFAFISLSSVFCLTLYFLSHRQIARTFPMPAMPTWALPFAVVLIATINGLREELMYRVVFQRSFAKGMAIGGAVALQALAFGFLHFQNGFPQGWLGVGLTFLFGVLMGAQFAWSRSIALAWMTHAVVDAAMFTIILLSR